MSLPFRFQRVAGMILERIVSSSAHAHIAERFHINSFYFTSVMYILFASQLYILELRAGPDGD